MIKTLPEDTSVEEATERLYLLSKIEKGLQQAENGNIISQEKVEKGIKKMGRLRWTNQAVKDVETIYEFVAKDSVPYARPFAKDTLQAVKRLAKFPKSVRIVSELSNENIRGIILGNYRIIYRIKQDVIEILTVYHSTRLLKADIDKNV